MHAHLITHAHTRQRKDVDSRQWVLSTTGDEQARALLDAPFWPDVRLIVVSSEAKTRLTAQPAADRFGLQIRVEPRLDELQRGGWIQDYATTVAQALENPQESVAGWESAAAAQARTVAALADLQDSYPDSAVAIVGHGISLSLARAWILGYPTVRVPEWQGLPFGAWATVDMTHRTMVQDFEFGPALR